MGIIGISGRKVDSSRILKELGIDFEVYCEEGAKPPRELIRFKDLLPELERGGPRAKALAEKNVYTHQYRGYRALRRGHNIIVRSGTGSGKTEIWVLYALTSNANVLVIYPTLALAADQVQRIEDYYTSKGLSKELVVKIDRPSIGSEELESVRGRLRNAKVLITNPAFLMADLKRLAEGRSKSYLHEFIGRADLIVIDELDFYGSRGSALLIAMLELIMRYVSSKNPKVVILTATLGNAEELAAILTGLNGRETEIIDGVPFKTRNCVFIVYGKNLDRYREEVVRLTEGIELDPEVKAIISDPPTFKRNVRFVTEYLRSIGVRVSEPYFDPAEIISRYVDDDGVTVVFTSSIRVAEKLSKRVKELLPRDKRSLVATHHHLIPKDVREGIERKARATPPKIKVIVTVRTLLQGIDIPNIVRVVHYGIPPEVREFLQREGRKGRREDVGTTESIIIPLSPWDRLLAAYGYGGIKEYVKLPLEKVYIVKDNKYAILFKALFKVMAGLELRSEELKILEDLDLVRKVQTLDGSLILKLNERGISVWNRFNFYEFGPPYGLRRYLMVDDHIKNLEPVSRRDLVEKYQPGMFDLSEDAVVIEADYNGIKEYPLNNLHSVREEYGYLNEALREYEVIKGRWGERADLREDFIKGKISSHVVIRVKVPLNGFGAYYEIPLYVKWVIESSRRVKFARYGSALVPYYDTHTINVESPTKGVYQDFTYGYIYELMPSVDTDLIKVAAASLRLILRLMPDYAISFRELEISLEQSALSPQKLIVWEPEASGITELIDWLGVIVRLRRMSKEPKIWLPLLKLIDSESANIVISRGLKWEDILSLTEYLVKYIGRIESVDLGSLKAYIPKPSPELGIISLELAIKEVRGEFYYAVAVYDGSKTKSKLMKVKIQPYLLSEVLANILRRVIDEELKLVTTSDDLLPKLVQSRSLAWLLEKALISGLIVNPFKRLKNCKGGDLLNVAELRRVFNIKIPDPTLIDDYIIKGKDVRKLLREYVEGMSKITYYAYLIFEYLRKEGKCFTKYNVVL